MSPKSIIQTPRVSFIFIRDFTCESPVPRILTACETSLKRLIVTIRLVIVPVLQPVFRWMGVYRMS
jgi:hypothetical protein